MDAIEILTRAKRLISNEKNWGQGGYAAYNDGLTTNVLNPDASRFCAVGATFRVTNTEPDTFNYDLSPEPNLSRARSALSMAARFFGHEFITQLNDTSNHETVMKAFDKAIDLIIEEKV